VAKLLQFFEHVYKYSIIDQFLRIRLIAKDAYSINNSRITLHERYEPRINGDNISLIDDKGKT